ncbi:hypothetical protein [Azospirillum sp. TSO22-1]|uniref:hypothetical protein n=1 Tax=Azospirillum sp. TSO22-1 TaxID=716789 RepID=UPI000D60702A|nr:hypothetical protein [Azospirillum sp. TSO22-1]PWC52977.1 hypothetical protein TSO221_12110 [Azospirillum sp. TSO22-1]
MTVRRGMLLAVLLLTPAVAAADPADEIRALDPAMAAGLERVATACAEPDAVADCQTAIRAWFATHDARKTGWQLDRLIEELRFDIEVAAVLGRMRHAEAADALQSFRTRHEALQAARRAAAKPPPADNSSNR